MAANRRSTRPPLISPASLTGRSAAEDMMELRLTRAPLRCGLPSNSADADGDCERWVCGAGPAGISLGTEGQLDATGVDVGKFCAADPWMIRAGEGGAGFRGNEHARHRRRRNLVAAYPLEQGSPDRPEAPAEAE